MRNKIVIVFALMTTIFIMSSCFSNHSFDKELLIGKWQKGTEYWRYDDDQTGYTWDEADDVDESEAQMFSWTLQGSTLTQKHYMEISGSVVPKTYKMVMLNSTSLVYEDEKIHVKYTFTRVD